MYTDCETRVHVCVCVVMVVVLGIYDDKASEVNKCYGRGLSVVMCTYSSTCRGKASSVTHHQHHYIHFPLDCKVIGRMKLASQSHHPPAVSKKKKKKTSPVLGSWSHVLTQIFVVSLACTELPLELSQVKLLHQRRLLSICSRIAASECV